MFLTMVCVVGLAASLSTGGDVAGNRQLTAWVVRAQGNLPVCLSRFRDYPPNRGKLGFPRCLFGNPFSANPHFWLKDVDFSCASPWNDTYGTQRAGTAISKRHIIFAQHFPMSTGTRMAFVGNTGEVSHYSIKATRAVEDSDIMIGLLDYELTPDVCPAKILPADFEKYLPVGSRCPVITFNQHEQAYLSEVESQSRGSEKEPLLWNFAPIDEGAKRFSGSLVGGDSGNPAFLLYNGNPILIYCVMQGGIGRGPLIHDYRRKIQKVMDDLCPGYKLEMFDFAKRLNGQQE